MPRPLPPLPLDALKEPLLLLLLLLVVVMVRALLCCCRPEAFSSTLRGAMSRTASK